MTDPLSLPPNSEASHPSGHSTHVSRPHRAHAVQRSAPRMASGPGIVPALAGLAATAGVIHVVATIEHVSEDQLLGVFFALVGAGQLYAGWRIYRLRYDQRLLTVAAFGSVAVALLWIVSRTIGVPFGPEADRVSAVGVADTIATLQELAFAAIVVLLVRRPDGAQRLAWLSGAMGTRLSSAILSASLFVAAVGGHEH